MMNKSEVVSLTALVIFAVLQVNLLLGRANPANHEVDALTSGDRVPPIVGLDETSTPVRIDWADTSITILFAFHSKRSEEHTSELQSRGHLVCRLLLEKTK